MLTKLKKLLTLFNAGATYAVPPLTAYRYGKLLFKLDKPDPEGGFRFYNRDPEFIKEVKPVLDLISKYYFRTEVENAEVLPKEGAGLIVGNHNGGLQPIDSFMTINAAIDSLGFERPIYGLCHDYLFREPASCEFLEKVGGLRAHPKAADLGLQNDGLVLVYPGGDLDTFKTFKNRHKIEFGNRKGFLKVAIRNQVPVYPVVSIGCHEMWYVITRGDKIGKALGLKERIRSEVFPIVFSLPWGISSGYFPYLPLPTKIKIKFLKPIHWPHLKPEDAENPVILQNCFDEVKEKMQQTMDEMAAKRKFPLIG